MKKLKTLALVFTLVLSIALLTGCTSSNAGNGAAGNNGTNDTTSGDNAGGSNSGDNTAGDDTADDGADGGEAQLTDAVGEITAVGEDGTVEVALYSGDADVSDYANADLSGFLPTEDTQTLTVGDAVAVYTAADGVLTEADAAALTAGAMVIFSSDAEGQLVQIVVVSTAEDAAA